MFVVALVSSLGGGLVRDALFLQRTPVLLTDLVYLPLIAVTTALLGLFTGPLTRILKADTVQKLIDVIDAVGIPIFAVIGMQLAEAPGRPGLWRHVRRRGQRPGRWATARCARS